MFAAEMTQFVQNLSALKEFVELIEPVFEERTHSIAQSRADDLAPVLLALKFPSAPSQHCSHGVRPLDA